MPGNKGVLTIVVITTNISSVDEDADSQTEVIPRGNRLP